MKNNFPPGYLLFFIILLGFLLILIQVELLTFAFEKLGLPPTLGLLILMLSLLGSIINLPLMRIKNDNPPHEFTPPIFWGMLRMPIPKSYNETLISVNLGGCLIPVSLSIWLFSNSSLNLSSTLIGITLITVLSYFFSRPIPGVGIGMPMLLAPVCAAIVGLLLSPEHSAPLAYISGTIGVLIGADLLHLKEIPKLGAPTASIGGAGTFDGIFITGIVAALLT